MQPDELPRFFEALANEPNETARDFFMTSLLTGARKSNVLAMVPGVADQRTHTYLRNGTTSLFAARDIATGAVVGKYYKRHHAREFLDFLRELD